MNRGNSVFNTLWFRGVTLLARFAAFLVSGIMVLVEGTLRNVLIREGVDKGLGIARGKPLNVEDLRLIGGHISRGPLLSRWP